MGHRPDDTLRHHSECDGCDHPDVTTKDYRNSFFSPFTTRRDEPINLCWLCAATDLGNAVAYPGSRDGDTVSVLRAVNFGNNEILNELRERTK